MTWDTDRPEYIIMEAVPIAGGASANSDSTIPLTVDSYSSGYLKIETVAVAPNFDVEIINPNTNNDLIQLIANDGNLVALLNEAGLLTQITYIILPETAGIDFRARITNNLGVPDTFNVTVAPFKRREYGA